MKSQRLHCTLNVEIFQWISQNFELMAVLDEKLQDDESHSSFLRGTWT